MILIAVIIVGDTWRDCVLSERSSLEDRDEVEKYWPSTVFFEVDPPITTPIGLDFQIGEPSWAGFTFDDTFYTLSVLLFWL